MTEQVENSNFHELSDTEISAEKTSRLSSVVFFLLCAVLIFSPVAYGAVETWSLGVVALFSALIVLFWILDAWWQNEFRFSTSLLQIPLFALILIGIIQLLPLWSPNLSNDLLAIPAAGTLTLDPYSTRVAVTQLVFYFVFFAAALVFISNQKRLQKIILVILIFGSIMAFFGILQRLANPEGIYGVRPTPQSIPFASFINQHHFAAFMEMTIGLTIALLFGKATKKDKRIFLIMAAVLMGIAIVFTGSRGGMLSLLGVLGFVITANLLDKKEDGELTRTAKAEKFRQRFILVGGSLALMLILFGSVFWLGGDESLLRGVGLQNSSTDVSSGRTHFWQVALQIFIHNPIFGAGLDSFGVAFTRYDTWNGTLRVEQAHNDYLQILADAGILGFACVTAFIYLLFKKSFQLIAKTQDRFRRSAAIGGLAGCFGILLHSFFDFPLRTTSNAFYFLTFAVLATAAIHIPKLHKTRK